MSREKHTTAFSAWVPNEILLHIAMNNVAHLSPIPHLPYERTIPSSHSLGIAAVDAVLSRYGEYIVAHIFSVPNDADTAGLDPWIVVRFRNAIDVKALIQELSPLSAIDSAIPNFYYMACIDPTESSLYNTNQRHLRTIECPGAWDLETGSSAVTVAIIDTGAHFAHPDLQGRLLQGVDLIDGMVIPGATIPSTEDISIVDNNPQDGNGHGTAMAGIIGAATNNGIGIAGVTWGCQILPIRIAASAILNGQRTAVTTARYVAQGIVWAADHNARIINCSLAGSYDAFDLIDPQKFPSPGNFGFLEYWAVGYAQRKNVLVVCGMGNDNARAIRYPAVYAGLFNNVIAVCGTNSSDRRWIETPSEGSNFNSYACISAPGERILTTVMPNDFRLSAILPPSTLNDVNTKAV